MDREDHLIHSPCFLCQSSIDNLGALEAVVIGADLRFDPARFVAQQQMNARRRLRQLRIDRRGKRVNQRRPLLIADPEWRAAVLAVMPVGRALMAVDRCIPYPERAFAFHFKSVVYAHDIDRVSAATRTLAADRSIAALIRVRCVAVDAEADRAAATRAIEMYRHLTSSERYSERERCHMLSAQQRYDFIGDVRWRGLLLGIEFEALDRGPKPLCTRAFGCGHGQRAEAQAERQHCARRCVRRGDAHCPAFDGH